MKSGKAQQYTLQAGIIRRRSMFDRLAVFNRTLKARLTTLVSVQIAIVLIIALAGILSTRDSNEKMRSTYEDRTVPLAQLFKINDSMQDNINVLTRAAISARAGKPILDVPMRVANNIATVSKVWAEYIATTLTPEESRITEAFKPKRNAFDSHALGGGPYHFLQKLA